MSEQSKNALGSTPTGVTSTSAGTRLLLVRSNEEVVEKFNRFLGEWRAETLFESNYKKIMSHPSYRRLVMLGPQVIPYILEDMKKGRGGVWFQTLEDMTGENPVLPEHEKESALMIADWLEWGKRNGVI